MSVQYKVPLLVLASLLLNILFVGLYYNLSLAKSISTNYSQNEAALEQTALEIAGVLEGRTDYGAALEEQAARRNLMAEVRDAGGSTLMRTGSETGVNFDLSAGAMFRSGGETLLLKVTSPISLGLLSSFSFVNDLFAGELTIIFVISLMLGLVLYFSNVRPIVALERTLRQYRQGVRPRKTRRRDEIGMLQNSFVGLTETLDEEKRIQSRMIASISHDIKTPLTSVMGYAEQLSKGNVSGERFTRYLEILYSKAVRIRELVDQFDEYLGFELQPALKKKKTTAGEVCRMAEEDCAEELRAQGVDFSVSCACPGHRLELDLPQVSRVFANLIANSLHYAGEHPSVSVRCEEQGGRALFSVSDNGPGVDPRELSRIFEPFYTSDASRRVAGLGLSICRSIVENHGGSIRAENAPGGGLTVFFLL